MKCSVLQENLAEALGLAVRAAAVASSLSVLRGIKLAAGGNILELSAMNLTIALTVPTGAMVEEEGECVVPARLFYELVKKLPKERIDLRYEKGRLHVHCYDYEGEMVCYALADFPRMHDLSGPPSLEVDASSLRVALDAVRFATASDESRPILTGVHGRLAGGRLTLEATDGYQMARITLPQVFDHEDFDLILPAEATAELSRLLAVDADATIGVVFVPKSGIGFATPVGDLYCQLIEGNYPDLRQIIPTSWSRRACLLAHRLQRAVAAASVLNLEGPLTLQIEPAAVEGDRGRVRVEGGSNEWGEMEVDVSAEVEGEPLRIHLNGGYLSRFLASLKGGELVLEAMAADKIMLWRLPEDEHYLYALMPVAERPSLVWSGGRV